LKPVSPLPVKFGSSIPLPLLLVLPFVLQVSAAVGLVGYLSFINGQKAVNELTYQLMSKAGQQVDGHLDSYLTLPQELAQVNRDAIASGQINLDHTQSNEQYFWQQARAFKHLSYIGYLLKDGRETGAGRWMDGKTLLIYHHPGSSMGKASDYLANNVGLRAKRIQSYDNDAWSLTANAEGGKATQPIWSKIYTVEVSGIQSGEASKMLQTPGSDINYQNYVSLPARSPIYDKDGKFIGIVVIDLLLSQISEFLSSLKVSPSGKVFIIERDGQLVGSSSSEPILQRVKDETKRFNALESPDPLIREITQRIKGKFQSFAAIQGTQSLDLQINDERHYVQVTPWKDTYGLDWLVVVTVPESDFMAQINANTRTTIGLCFGALVGASLLGFLTSRWIANPILQLSRASESLASASQAGFSTAQLEQHIALTGIQELDTMGRSFNCMAEKLKNSFMELAQSNAELENRVEERTAELSQTLINLRHTQAQMVQSEKMSALGQMVAGVAHEINNPVNFIHGNLRYVEGYTTDLLQLTQLYQKHYPQPPAEIYESLEAVDIAFVEEDLAKVLQSMHIGTTRIREIVLSLRNFSRLDEADFKMVDIHEGIDSTLTILQNRLKGKPDHPAIEVIKDYSLLPKVECYAGQLNQVFMNILNNAIDALDEYQQTHDPQAIPAQPSQITIHTTLASDQWVRIQIADNGGGMDETVRSSIFNPFFTTKPVGQGTGLGLSISYQIVVEKHNGRIDCQSQLGTGTQFTIEIPIQQKKQGTEIG
jgi:signal transduction histidine kinase